MQIIAYCVESALLVERACYKLNEYLLENKEKMVGGSEVHLLVKGLKLEVSLNLLISNMINNFYFINIKDHLNTVIFH